MPTFVPYLVHILFPPTVRRPTEIGAEVMMTIAAIALGTWLTRARKWGWLWREWITTTDHKKIGVMYLVAALLMLFRGGVDALMMRTNLALLTSRIYRCTKKIIYY